MFTLTYKIPKNARIKQRLSCNKLTNLSKKDLSNWLFWLATKKDAKYTIS